MDVQLATNAFCFTKHAQKYLSTCIVLGNIDTSNDHHSINDQPVNTVRKMRDLGVLVDSSLKFNSHISYKLTVAKANSRASLIHKCFVTQP